MAGPHLLPAAKHFRKTHKGAGIPAPPLPPTEANAAKNITRGGIVAPPPLPLAAASPASPAIKKRRGDPHITTLK